MPTKAVRLTMPLVGAANPSGYLVMVPGASVLIRQNGVALVGSAGPGTPAVFSDNNKTAMTNPVPTGVTPGTAGVDTAGRLVVYLNPGKGYDVQATVGNVTTAAPLPDVGVDVDDVQAPIPADTLVPMPTGTPVAGQVPLVTTPDPLVLEWGAGGGGGVALAKLGTTLGESTLAGASVVVSVDTDWGVSGGVPYYAPGAVVPGEEAVLTVDPSTGLPVVVQIDTAAVAHNVDPTAHAGDFVVPADLAPYVPFGGAPKVYREAGRYFAADARTAPLNSILAEGTITLTNVEVDRALSVNAALINVNTGGTSPAALLRLLIYSNKAGGLYPDALLWDSGTFEGTTTGSRNITISPALALTPGTYWVGAVIQGGAATRPQTTCFTNAGSQLSVVGGFAVGTTATAGYGSTGHTGAPPATFPAGEVPIGTAHRVWLKVA